MQGKIIVWLTNYILIVSSVQLFQREKAVQVNQAINRGLSIVGYIYLINQSIDRSKDNMSWMTDGYSISYFISLPTAYWSDVLWKAMWKDSGLFLRINLTRFLPRREYERLGIERRGTSLRRWGSARRQGNGIESLFPHQMGRLFWVRHVSFSHSILSTSLVSIQSMLGKLGLDVLSYCRNDNTWEPESGVKHLQIVREFLRGRKADSDDRPEHKGKAEKDEKQERKGNFSLLLLDS